MGKGGGVRMEGEDKEIISVIDEELDKCIKKLRNAVYGYEIRTFITEYEELMLKKSDVVVQKFLKSEEKIEKGEHRTASEMIHEAKNKSRQALYISWTALLISVGYVVIRILMAL